MEYVYVSVYTPTSGNGEFLGQHWWTAKIPWDPVATYTADNINHTTGLEEILKRALIAAHRDEPSD